MKKSKKAKDKNKPLVEPVSNSENETVKDRNAKNVLNKKSTAFQTLASQKAAKRKKTKRITSIVTLITGIALTAFVVIAFTGRIPGSFTINLKQTGAHLALDSDTTFDNASTYLKMPEMPAFDFITASLVDTKGHVAIDNDLSNYDKNPEFGVRTYVTPSGEEIKRTEFYKYTFYVRNLGTAYANYTMSVNITENIKPKGWLYGYDSVLRVRLYSNLVNDDANHEYVTYAKPADYKNVEDIPLGPDGKPDHREHIAGDSGPKAETFDSATRITTRSYDMVGYNETRRFTLVAWLEGSDPQTTSEPNDGSLKIGVTINGSAVEED